MKHKIPTKKKYFNGSRTSRNNNFVDMLKHTDDTQYSDVIDYGKHTEFLNNFT